jgi:hypothetical protein
MLGFPTTAAMFSNAVAGVRIFFQFLEHDGFQLLYIATVKPRRHVVIKHM